MRRIAIGITLGAALQPVLLLLVGLWSHLCVWTGRKIVMDTHMTVIQQGPWYWDVTVLEIFAIRTSVTAEPWDSRAGAERSVAMAYETLPNLEMPDAPGKVVLSRADRVPAWADFSRHDPERYRLPWKPEKLMYEVTQDALGWPWRAFRAERVYATVMPPLDDAGQSTGSPVTNSTQSGYLNIPRYGPIPAAPIWSGLVLDTLVLAIPLIFLQWSVGVWRASMRRRRGRCGACNYDRSGIEAAVACPECGDVPRE
jgi:hypothetical protein